MPPPKSSNQSRHGKSDYRSLGGERDHKLQITPGIAVASRQATLSKAPALCGTALCGAGASPAKCRHLDCSLGRNWSVPKKKLLNYKLLNYPITKLLNSYFAFVSCTCSTFH